MDLLKMAAELFLKQLGNGQNLDLPKVIGAFQNLLPTENGQLNLGALVAQFSQGGLDNLVQSFLGDGANMNMSVTQIMSILGHDRISQFAGQLNMPEQDAAENLSNVIPQLIDQNSQGGALGGLAGQIMGGLFK